MTLGPTESTRRSVPPSTFSPLAFAAFRRRRRRSSLALQVLHSTLLPAYEYLRRPAILQMAAPGDAAKEYVAGAAAGVAQVVVGHPFDTVKVYIFLSSFPLSSPYMRRSPQIRSCFLVNSVGFLPCYVPAIAVRRNACKVSFST